MITITAGQESIDLLYSELLKYKMEHLFNFPLRSIKQGGVIEGEDTSFMKDNQEKLIKDALCNRKQYQGNGNR